MHDLVKELRQKAKKSLKKIVFPESTDERVLSAVEYINKEKIAEAVLIDKDKLDSKYQEEFANDFFERRKAKGLTFQEARESMEDPLYYSAMLTRFGYVDGFVAGAQYTTSKVVRASLYCLNLDESTRILTSCLIMLIPDCSLGEAGTFIYADCGVIPNPSSEQLASIAISSATFAKSILSIEPKVAMLSFSSKGSSGGKYVDKIRDAVNIARSGNNKFLIDGELQADSALIPEVAARKVKDSPVAGGANILIFPNLDAGNICYKLTQRLAKARAIGPIILGTVEPCSDLSRGCNIDDIIDCTAITAIRAQKRSFDNSKKSCEPKLK